MAHPDPTDACAEARRIGDSLAEGGVPTAEERRFLDAHRQRCEDCAAEAAVAELLRYQGPDDSPAPPLDDLARRRLIRSVTAAAARPVATETAPAPRRRLQVLVALAAGVLVASGVGLGFYLGRQSGTPGSRRPVPAPAGDSHLARAQGRVTLVGAPATAGARLAPGSRVEVQDGLAVLSLPDGARVLASAGSRLVLADLSAGRTAVRLDQGTIWADVDPRPGRRPFHVVTARGGVEVTGTFFSVAVADGRTTVAVGRGRVKVVEPGRPVRAVAAAEITALGEAEPRVRPQAAEERRALEQGATSLAVVLPPTERPVAVRSPDPPAADAPGLAPVEVARPSVPPAPGSAVRPPVAPPVPPTPPVESPELDMGPAPGSPPALIAQARERRAARDWSGAAVAYRRLIADHGGSAEAQSARVALGNLLLDHLGDAAGALTVLDDCLSRQRGGVLAEEASLGRIRALRRLGRTAVEVTAIRDHLQRFPRSLEAAALRARFDVLARQAPR